MAKSKTIIAKHAFLHPVTKKRVPRGSVVTDTKDVPEAFLEVYTEVKEVKE